MDGDLLFRDLGKRNWIILFLLGSASTLLMDRSFTTGVLLGGLIIIGNFSALQQTVRRAFAPKRKVKSKVISMIATLAKFFFRFFAMVAIIFFLIGRGWADPVGLAVGLSTVVFSIVSFGISSATKSGARGAT